VSEYSPDDSRPPHSTKFNRQRDNPGLTVIGALLDDPIQESEYRRAFVAMVRERVEGLVVGDFAENYVHRQLIVELAAQSRLPTIYPFREFVDVGGLMAYSVDLPDLFRRVAGYIDRIFKGANPGRHTGKASCLVRSSPASTQGKCASPCRKLSVPAGYV
jgi:ABC-type uncharacterized transport system substrate-binding protein